MNPFNRPAWAFNPALQDGVVAWVGLRMVVLSTLAAAIGTAIA